MIHEVAIPLDDVDSDHAVVGTLTDITEQRVVLEQTQFLTHACRALLENDPRPAALLNASLSLTCVNQRLADYLQLSAEALIGQSIDILAEHFSLRDPATHPAAQTPLSQTFREVAKQVIETNKSCLALPCAFLQPETQNVSLSFDCLPIAHPPDPSGLLLRLNSETRPD
jgi:PAS domain-containing protein